MISNAIARRDWWRSLLTIALPVALQNLLSSSVNLVDNLMVGQLGDAAIAGLGIANQVFFLMLFFIFGVNNGASILVAQCWGKRDIPAIRRILGICLTLGGGAAAVFTAVSVLLPGQVIGLFSTDPQVIATGASYLGIVGWSYVATAISFSYAILLRSVERATAPMVVSFGAIVLNCLGNYVLIFGMFGFPRLGVAGSAIATCIARYLECAVLVFLVYRKKYPLAGRWGELFSASRELIALYVRRAGPVILQEFSWAFGITLYQAVYAHVGTATVAAVNIVTTIERFVFIVFVGLGSSAGATIGKSIGAERSDQAAWLGLRYLGLGIVIALGLGLGLFGLRNWVLGFYQISPQVLGQASAMFGLLAMLLWVKAGNMLLISGVFRSGGDTRFAFLLDSAGIWLVGLPLGLVVAFVVKADPSWVYLAIGAEEAFKLAVALWRFRSGKWVNNLVRDIA